MVDLFDASCKGEEGVEVMVVVEVVVAVVVVVVVVMKKKGYTSSERDGCTGGGRKWLERARVRVSTNKDK